MKGVSKLIDIKDVRAALKEVISRYDADEDGELSPKEAFCFLQGFWGVGYSPSHVQLVKDLYTNPKYAAKKVEKIGDWQSTHYKGYIPLDGMIRFCEVEMDKSNELQNQVYNSLVSHGYDINKKEGKVKLKLMNPPRETYQTLCLRLAQSHLKSPRNINLMQWLMEIGNGMIEHRERPNEELMKILGESKVFGDSEAQWDNMEADWRLSELLAQGNYLEKSGLHWSKKFIEVFKKVFALYDGDKDSILTRDEMRLFRSVLTGRIPNQSLLEIYMKHATLEKIMAEALESENSRKNLLSFVFWHGYNENLHLLPSVNLEPINQNTLILHLCQKIESKKGKNVDFEVDLLSNFIQFMLYEEEALEPSNEVISAIRNVLGIKNLQDIFELKRGKVETLSTIEEAFQVFALTLQYTAKDWGETTPESSPVTFIRNAEEAILSRVKEQPIVFVEFLSSKNTLEQLRGIPSIKNYLDQRMSRRGHISIIPQIIESLSFKERFTGYFKQLWKLIDPVALVIFAMKLVGALIYSSAYNSNVIINLLKRLDDDTGKSVLQNIVEQKIVAQELVDYYYCLRFKEPYPDILPRENELIQMTADQIADKLADYCGVPQAKIDAHFRMYKIIGSDQSIGNTILKDAKQLQKYGIDRKTVAKKFAALLGIEKGKNLQADSPYRVVKCYTAGHHPDVFHPTHGELCYYLESDRVGGSADCLIINKTLVSEEHQEEVIRWSEGDIENLLVV